MTDEQALTLARLMRDFNAREARITVGPFDLPEGYIVVELPQAGMPGNAYVVGIAPNGDASS